MLYDILKLVESLWRHKGSAKNDTKSGMVLCIKLMYNACKMEYLYAEMDKTNALPKAPKWIRR